MTAHDGVDTLAVLDLPQGIHAQADQLLQAIRNCRTIPDTLRAIDRAEGFALGADTAHAPCPANIEAL